MKVLVLEAIDACVSVRGSIAIICKFLDKNIIFSESLLDLSFSMVILEFSTFSWNLF